MCPHLVPPLQHFDLLVVQPEKRVNRLPRQMPPLIVLPTDRRR